MAKRPKPLAVSVPPPPVISSEEDDDFRAAGLDILDKWRAGEDNWLDLPTTLSKYVKESYIGGPFPHRDIQAAQGDDWLFLHTQGCVMDRTTPEILGVVLQVH
ncbi:Hypothetical predicted protein [Pelobates cultripes]|uniref:Uncharacterized protein n=1 Tax=Pelobates cultripes TaxID=61616 RepID=A0AAD1W360_PELCU|nr:Hypothetical predicted protein [Pelobates cultripes]